MLYDPGGSNDDGKPATTDDEIVREAVERYLAVKEWQGVEDDRTREDIKFANADDRNLWQWPKRPYEIRGESEKPCLTINNTRVHNDIIINAMSKNRYGVKVRPVGGKASYKSAQAMEMLIRRTEYISRASTHYRTISEQQVDGGIAYMLLETAYVSNKSMKQDIYMKAARDPTAVYLDPWIQQIDGLDARFGLTFERLSRKEFNRKHPKWKNKVGSAPLDQSMGEWLSDSEVMLAKYYRKRETADRLIWYKDPDSGEEIERLRSEMREESGKELVDALMEQIKNGEIDGGSRKVSNDEVEWFLIAGNTIVDRGDWPGIYIPICRCVGRETVVDRTLDRKGHTRPLISAQHMLNYNASTAVEYAASAVKAQWLGSARAFEGQESWKDGNVQNYAVMQYNDVDDEAPGELQTIPPPQRIDPPRANPAAQQGMQDAERQMMMISGQFEAQMGENDTQSAASGKAIGERKEQGDTATYHFVEHFGDMLRAVGVQLLDLYPKIYDTERALHIIGDDGEKFWMKVDPNQTDVIQEMEHEKDDEEAIKLSFNPALGEYECVSDPGPSYATQRQEAWEAMGMILQNNKELAASCADLLFAYGDFPGADKLRERLEKEIKATKPYLFDGGPEPGMIQAQQQMQKLTALNGQLMQKLAMRELALKGKDEKRDIEASRAETDRMKVMIEALARLTLTPQQRAQMEHEIELRSHDTAMDMVIAANQGEIDAQAATLTAGGEQ